MVFARTRYSTIFMQVTRLLSILLSSIRLCAVVIVNWHSRFDIQEGRRRYLYFAVLLTSIDLIRPLSSHIVAT